MVGFKQFRIEGCYSYILYDRDTRDAAVIDPQLAMMDEYRSFVGEERLKPRLVLETSTHVDHDSASHLLRMEYGSEIGMSARTRSLRATRKWVSGDRIGVGRLSLEALETPGHTEDSVCYFGEGLVFTGNTLLIGATGRTDLTGLAGSDPAALWSSLRQQLASLPADTLVYPAHDYRERLFSTIEIEKARNPHWRASSPQEITRLKAVENGPGGEEEELRRHLAFNRASAPDPSPERGSARAAIGGSPSDETSGAATISVEKYRHKLLEPTPGNVFLDLRERGEFREGHMEGAENIPISELGFHLGELRQARTIYLSCLLGRRSEVVARTLGYLGFADVVNVRGGFKAWVNSGFQVVK